MHQPISLSLSMPPSLHHVAMRNLSVHPSAHVTQPDKASMTCRRLAIYLSINLSFQASVRPSMHQPNFTHSLTHTHTLSLSLLLYLSPCPHLCIFVAMRSSLPTSHAIMWCFWPYSAISLSIFSCIPQVNYGKLW